MLTVKQKVLLDYLKSYYSEKMVFPTFDEMRFKLNIKSKSGIHKLLKSLEEKNYIKRLPHKARALTINDFKNKIEDNETSLPFLGRIAAGNQLRLLQIVLSKYLYQIIL